MYVLLLDELDRHVLNERVVVVTALAAGAKGLTMPDSVTARAMFDGALEAAPRVIDREQWELMRALGVGRG